MSLTGTVPMRGQSPKYRLAFLTTHPIQYQAPLFRKLADSPHIDLHVYFCSSLGLDGNVDPGFGVSIKWDVPLLEGYPHTFLKNLPIASNPLRFWSFLNPSILREISSKRYDALVVHGYGHATYWLAFGAALWSGVPIILNGDALLHHSRGSLFRALKKALFPGFLRMISACLYIGTRSREFYNYFGVSNAKLFFFPYSVDNDFFRAKSKMEYERRDKTRAELGISKEETVVLCVSKLYPLKRPHDAIKAVRQISGKVRLVFAGDGVERPELEKYVSENGLRNVLFLGFKNQMELPRYYAMADIFLFTSALDRFGLVVNEAMCFGLPVITTDGVSCAVDLVRPEENGFIYPVGDVDALSGYLKRLVESRETRRLMGQRSLEIISTWNHSKCVEGILSALAAVVKRKE